MLGNDLTQESFDKVNVRFPPKKAEYKIRASVTQDNFPPKEFEFTVSIEPEFREKIVHVYEEATQEDKDPEVLEKRIEELGNKQSEEK